MSDQPLKPLPGHFVGNFAVVAENDDVVVVAPQTHVWHRERQGSCPGEPHEYIVYCTNCGVEQTDDNATEACE